MEEANIFCIYLWYSVFIALKISVTTKDTAELNVKHVKHNVITTKSIKMALANLILCICEDEEINPYLTRKDII